MDVSELILRILDSEDPGDAFTSLAEGLAEAGGARAVEWRGPQGEILRWPIAAPRPRLQTGAEEDERTVPLPGAGGELGVRGGALEEEPARRLVRAFDRAVGRLARLRRAESERDELQRRAEESEALHVLGLSANRSLDPDEVLALVARLSRTLLGAHYVTVSTGDGDQHTVAAAVGLKASVTGRADPLATRVIASGKPVTLEPGAGNHAIRELRLHHEEGMRAGLGIPLSLFGETFGALVIGYRRAYAVQPRDVRLALTLAGHAAVAISNARLHRTLADRSRELERAYQELRWAAEAKERFFATMSHELRTPINAILGYQSLLLEEVAGELPAPARRFLVSAHRATQNLLLLVNDVLDLSKIEAGKMELFIRPINLLEVVDEALSMVQPQAAAKELPLRVVLPPEPEIPLRTDADRVRQILLNLLSNAIKFTEQGEVEVCVERVAEPGPGRTGGRLQVRIADTGPGVQPEDQERIFHEFEQVMGAAARGGTGLGLPISRKLARLMGGDLTVQSQVGSGSTFVLSLPLHPPADAGTQVATGSGVA